MEESAEIKTVKSMLRSVLLSCKEGVPANVLLRDYQEVVGEQLPFRRLGFRCLEDFILSIPDVVRIDRRGQDFIFHAVADETTAHIKALVSKQRSKRKLKAPIRRPRGGRASNFVPRPRGPPPQPLLQRMRPIEPRSQPGMPSFIPQQYRKPIPMVTVEIGNSTVGPRTIHVGKTEILNRAMHDVQRQRRGPNDRTASNSYVPPPRFRKKAHGHVSPPSEGPVARISHARRHEKEVSFAHVTDGDQYLKQLSQYMRENNEGGQFQTTPGANGYASSITVNRNTYGSEAIFETPLEAEQAAARNAILNLNNNHHQQQQPEERLLPELDWNNTTGRGNLPSLPADQISVIKSRMQEILKTKKNGLWSTRIPFEYKEKFKEDPPDNLVEIVKKWPDVARFEVVGNTDREIVFPAEEQNNEHMNLVIPKEVLLKKDEGVTVYISFIYNPGYFCVQREDSTIDNITDLLQVHCQSVRAVNPELLKKGMSCAGIFSGDGNWTRAEVLHLIDKDTVELLFVDYGNVEKVKVSNIRWLSPELTRTPVQSITCSLFGMEPLEDETEWSSKSSILFAKHVEDKALTAVPRMFYDDLVDVELFLQTDKSVNVATLLCNAGVILDVSKVGMPEEEEVLEPDALILPEDKEWDVHVTYISSSTNSVMLRLVGDMYSDKLDMFQLELEKAFRKTDRKSEIVEGGIYVAYDDELYHRVRAMSVETGKVLCYFLDHGDTDHLLSEQLKPLDPKVNCQLPYQAIEIRLSGLEEVSTNVTALEKLCDITLGKTCVAYILDRGEIPSLVLYDTSSDTEVNINETILKTIEKEGGGIDSPRVSSPLPDRVVSPAPGSRSTTPNVVTSPATSFTSVTSVSSNKASCDIKSNTPSVAIQNDLSVFLNVSSVKTESGSPQYSQTRPSLDLSSTNSVEAEVLHQLKGLGIDEAAASASLPSASSTQALTPPPFLLPSPGGYMDVHVPFVFDPHNFVCMPCDFMNTLNKLLVDMLDYYESVSSPMNPEEIHKGFVYAGVRDGIWARVKVQEFVGTDLVSVYSVDIGEYSVMMLSELQPLAEQFTVLPMMAMVGKLGRIQPNGGTWYEAAKYKFIELARGKDLVALVQGRDEETNIVDLRLIDTSDDMYDVCIDEVLVKMGFADLL